ncbi:MAG TPA: hypothetical protein PKD85_09470, partial [Saprospiraceae bacterium]|nr:hypothetical protein [Saprospiraceae bacterium]
MQKIIGTFSMIIMAGIMLSAQKIQLKTERWSMEVSGKGQVMAMAGKDMFSNYVAQGEQAPLLQIRVGDQWHIPTKATFKSGMMTLQFLNEGISAQIKILQKKTHITFELINLSAKDKVNAVIWGPFPTVIGKTIGEVVGVVRDGSFAIGLQALNPKTVGGVFHSSEGANKESGATAIGSTATAQPYGSSLQAFSLDRSKDRVLTVWGRPEMHVKAIPNETTIGSKIALFGCEEAEVLSRIGEIEVAEG